jgi:hypothetical protein
MECSYPKDRLSDNRASSKLIEHFQIVHEKLFHLFVISQDLQYFVHDHPTFGPDGKFRYEITFPKPGLYRILGDFYPDGATPQLIAKTIIVLGGSQSTPSLNRDYSTRDAGNMQVSSETDPPDPIAGTKTMMFFKLNPGEGLEKYIGAWGHMLAASDDLIDLIHTHPFIADGGPNKDNWAYLAVRDTVTRFIGWPGANYVLKRVFAASSVLGVRGSK